MLRFLTDEHISPEVAGAARRILPEMQIVSLREWREGEFLGLRDDLVLTRAAEEKLTIVTYDQKTFRPLLKRWIEEAHENRGAVFIDYKSIAPHEFGRLARALCALWKHGKSLDWKDRVVFLRSVD